MVGFDGRYKKKSYFFFSIKSSRHCGISSHLNIFCVFLCFFFFFFFAKVVLIRSHNILTLYGESAEIVSALSSNPPISEAIV